MTEWEPEDLDALEQETREQRSLDRRDAEYEGDPTLAILAERGIDHEDRSGAAVRHTGAA